MVREIRPRQQGGSHNSSHIAFSGVVTSTRQPPPAPSAPAPEIALCLTHNEDRHHLAHQGHNLTLCGRPVSDRFRVSHEHWKQYEAAWCMECERAMKKCT